MTEEQPRRKPRIPLSPTELYYFIELKKLKQAQKIESFKASFFYKLTNGINIGLAAVLTYCIISLLMLNYWQKTYVLNIISSYGETKPHNFQRTISELQIKTTSGEFVIIKTDDLFDLPTKNQEIYLGKDFLFGKIIKAKLAFDERPFWSLESYARFTVCIFALAMGFFIYKVNKHLTINGLLVTFGLFFLASAYFVSV
ncbi:MAG: hypothetical protein V4506_16675 [Bacteroidota bacterium]